MIEALFLRIPVLAWFAPTLDPRSIAVLAIINTNFIFLLLLLLLLLLLHSTYLDRLKCSRGPPWHLPRLLAPALLASFCCIISVHSLAPALLLDTPLPPAVLRPSPIVCCVRPFVLAIPTIFTIATIKIVRSWFWLAALGPLSPLAPEVVALGPQRPCPQRWRSGIKLGM